MRIAQWLLTTAIFRNSGDFRGGYKNACAPGFRNFRACVRTACYRHLQMHFAVWLRHLKERAYASRLK